MISICIPIYNFDVRQLVETLAYQIESLEIPFELVLIDDCSSDVYREINQRICEQFTYILLPENIGRSKIRNLFLKHTKFDYLLFLDCDSIVQKSDFLESYLKSINPHNLVICGGRKYPSACPDKSRSLRWNYGIKRESQDVFKRRENPNRSFMTNNFLIHRDLFFQIPFDETLSGYGHEDTLMGYFLKCKSVEIFHIENPILNGDIETNIHFIEKTEQGIVNLSFIAQKMEFDRNFTEDISLLKAYLWIKKYKLLPLYNLLFFWFKKRLKLLLKKGNSKLIFFDLYKLGLFAESIKSEKLTQK